MAGDAEAEAGAGAVGEGVEECLVVVVEVAAVRRRIVRRRSAGPRHAQPVVLLPPDLRQPSALPADHRPPTWRRAPAPASARAPVPASDPILAKVLGLASALLQASARHAINSTTSSICQQVVADEVAIWPLRLEAPWPVARLRTSSKTDPARCRQVASDLARVSVLVEVSAQVWASAPEQVSSPQQVSALEQASARVSASDREQAPDPDNYRATEGLPETGRTASRIAKVVKEIDKTDAMKSAIK